MAFLNRDFTVKKYNELLDAFKKAGYNFQTVEDFVLSPLPKVVILRHDVDLNEKAALRLAKNEKSWDIKATYYFRKRKEDFNIKIIKKIAYLGHEIGYHYEDLSSAKGNYEIAIQTFLNNLNKLRKVYPVKTICMHGRSGSPYDNRDLWIKYNYKDYGIICEPYLDFDFNMILYLTDTVRCWNGNKYSLRDKVQTNYNFYFKTTNNIIEHINDLPDKILITTHPEHWTNNLLEWILIKLFEFIHIIYKKYYRNKVVKRNAVKEI